MTSLNEDKGSTQPALSRHGRGFLRGSENHVHSSCSVPKCPVAVQNVKNLMNISTDGKNLPLERSGTPLDGREGGSPKARRMRGLRCFQI